MEIKEKQQKELQTLSKPLVEFIRKEYTPMTTLIVTGVGIEVLNTEIHVRFDDDWH